MTHDDLMTSLRNGLVVSCQAPPDDPLSGPDNAALMARSVLQPGVVGIRAEGLADIAAIRRAVALPVIGLWKVGDARNVYITPELRHALAVALAGAEIVAVDGTQRERPDHRSLATVIEALHDGPKCLVLADVATLDEGLAAADQGADLVSTTLSGYTSGSPATAAPDLELVGQLAERLDIPVVAEGRFRTPEQARRAFERGAWTVVVGAAITRPRLIASWFVEAIGRS